MRLRRPSPALITLTMCGALLLLRLSNSAQFNRNADSQTPPREVQISAVLDGDTVETSSGERVRLLGIDAPEVAHHDQAAQPYGEQSTAWLTKVLLSERVLLKFDRETQDRYGRTLAWIYLADGRLVNLMSLESGHARLLDRFGLPADLENDLRDAQARAQVQRLGVWK